MARRARFFALACLGLAIMSEGEWKGLPLLAQLSPWFPFSLATTFAPSDQSAEQCGVENDTRYAGYDYTMPDGKLKCSSDIKSGCTQRSPVPDVDICKSFCHANDYFTWISSTKECFCKKSDSGKGQQSGSVSGPTKCPGKISWYILMVGFHRTW